MGEHKTKHTDLYALAAARFARSQSVPTAFFTAEAEHIAQACWLMAQRFHRGGRLLAFGSGACATDAQHVSVEFVHPVIVGKRALPALALTNDSATLSGLMMGPSAQRTFARQLSVLARPEDIAMGFSLSTYCPDLTAAFTFARSKGLLTLALLGKQAEQTQQEATISSQNVDFCFVIPTDDPFVIQETHETLYHVLWELVHVFFEHEGLLTS